MRMLVALTVAATVFVLQTPAKAQSEKGAKKLPTASQAITATKPATESTSANAAGSPDSDKASAEAVTGFRSAKFGMNEADTRAAIVKDFGVKADAIRAQDNPAELTHSVLVTVPDLLSNGGTAEVSYVFGYKSKTLIQVGTVWSKATDATMTPEKLFSNANILRAHFLNASFRPDSIAVNTPINGGLLMFRGSDAKDRTVILLLQGTFENKADNQRILTPTGLLLFYVADAKSPDVFKLPPGQF